MQKSLNDFINDNQKYLKLEDGESVDADFLGFRVIASKYDSNKETVEYGLKVNGKTLIWTNGNVDIAKKMMNLKKGDPVRILKIVDGKKTFYKVTSPAIAETKATNSNQDKAWTDDIAETHEDDVTGDEVPF